MRLPPALALVPLALFTGCASSRLAPLETVPDTDAEAAVYYLRPQRNLLKALVGSDVHVYRTTLSTDETSPVLAGAADDGLLSSYVLAPGVSSSGRYVMAAKEWLGVSTSAGRRQQRLALIDAEGGGVVLEFDVDRTRTKYDDDPFWPSWAPGDDAFYVADRDTVKKRWPDGRVEALATASDLHAFAVAPDEASVLLFHGDTVSLHAADGTQREVTRIGSKAFGLGRRYVRGLAWGSGQRVAFAEGWQVYVYDAEGDAVEEYRAGREVFDLIWLSPSELLLVEGEYPSDVSTMQTQRSYRLVRLDLGTSETTRLYGSLNHEPLSVKPRLSPSGELLLFAERGFDDGGRYRVKVLSVDGTQLRILDEGLFPVWR